jgi:hypothetical protein
MKNLILLFIATGFFTTSIAKDPDSYFVHVGYGAGYKPLKFTYNNIGMTIPAANIYSSFSYQHNYIDKGLSFKIEFQDYGFKKKLDNYSVTYSDNYILIGMGKNLTKRWEASLMLGVTSSQFKVKKEILNYSPDSTFKQFKFLSNEYSSRYTLASKASLRYTFYSSDKTGLKLAFQAETLFKLKTEKFFENTGSSKFLYTLGINIGIRLR